jgi:GTPase SAR1 family protein
MKTVVGSEKMAAAATPSAIGAIGKKGEDERIVIKVIVLGCANVGKTSLMKRYCNNKFSHERKATTGTDFASKRLEMNGKVIIPFFLPSPHQSEKLQGQQLITPPPPSS